MHAEYGIGNQPPEISTFIRYCTYFKRKYDLYYWSRLDFGCHVLQEFLVLDYSVCPAPMCVWIVWVGLYGWGRWNFVLSSRKSAMGNTLTGGRGRVMLKQTAGLPKK